MKYFAVVDTNVLVSAFLKEKSIPWKILNYIRSQVIVPIYNEDILNEYSRVLRENNFGFDEEIIENTINLIQSVGIGLESSLNIDEYFPDPDDIKFYRIVMSSRMVIDPDSRLITGNQKHFLIKEFIVSPSEMVEIIEKK